MEKEELMFLDFLRVFFRRGAEDAFQYIMRREVLSNDQIERLKNVVLKQYQIWYLIDEAREKFNPNINENWALALVSSTLIENVVKQSLLSFGCRPTRNFEENAKRLVELAEKQGVKLDLSELIEAWGGRRIPVHEAYKYPVSAESAQRSYERALRLINTLSPLLKK
jgi:hypothetical protein